MACVLSALDSSVLLFESNCCLFPFTISSLHPWKLSCLPLRHEVGSIVKIVLIPNLVEHLTLAKSLCGPTALQSSQGGITEASVDRHWWLVTSLII